MSSSTSLVLHLTPHPCTALPPFPSNFVQFQPQPVPLDPDTQQKQHPHQHNHTHFTHSPHPQPTTIYPLKPPCSQPIQWVRHTHPELPPLHGSTSLSSAIHTLRPDRIYLLLPSIPIHDLSPCDVRPFLEAEEALRHFRMYKQSVNNTPTLSSSSLRVSASPTVKITLLFDNLCLSKTDIAQYDAVFQPNEALSSHAAASILQSRIHYTTSKTALWSGSIVIPNDNNNNNNKSHQLSNTSIPSTTTTTATATATSSLYPIDFPGFHLVKSTSCSIKLPKTFQPKKSTQAQILTMAKRMPDIGACHAAVPGFHLRLSQDCPSRTAALFNQLAISGNGILVAIGDLRFWCFWTSPNFQSSHTGPVDCRALYLAPLSRVSAPALDTVAQATRLHVRQELQVRKLPTGLAALPIKPFFPIHKRQTEEEEQEEETWPTMQEQMIKNHDPNQHQEYHHISSLEDTITRMNNYRTSSSQVIKREQDVFDVDDDDDASDGTNLSPGDWNTSCDASQLELNALEHREKDKGFDNNSTNNTNNYWNNLNNNSSSQLQLQLPYSSGKSTTGPNTRSDSRKGSGREMRLAFRQRRFQRLMQTQREKRTKTVDVNNTSNSNIIMGSTSQRSKRARCNPDIGTGVVADNKNGLTNTTTGISTRRRVIDKKNNRQLHHSSNANASAVFVGQAIRQSLNALDSCSPFFNNLNPYFISSNNTCNIKNTSTQQQTENNNENSNTIPHSQPPTYSMLGKHLCEKDISNDPARFSSKWSRTARLQHGCHGVEYLWEGDVRDCRIKDYEDLVAKTETEFSTKQPLTKHDCMKITSALNTLVPGHVFDHANDNDTNKDNDYDPLLNSNDTNHTALLLALVKGLRSGSVVIHDRQLRKQLLEVSAS